MKGQIRRVHGETSQDGRLRFWAYSQGREYWVTKFHYAQLTKKALAHKRRRYAENPEKYRAKQRGYVATERAKCAARARDRKRSKTSQRKLWARAWMRAKKASSPSFAISVKLRVRLANAMKRYAASKAKSSLWRTCSGAVGAISFRTLNLSFRLG